MHTRSLWALVFALLFLLPATVEGQKVQPSERGPWEINVFAGGFDDKWEFDPDGSVFYIDPDGNVMFGGALNYHFSKTIGPFGLFTGLEGRYVPLDINTTIRKQPRSGQIAKVITDLNAYFGNLHLGITLPLHERLDVYGLAGGSVVNWRPENDFDSEINFGLTYGGGVRIYLMVLQYCGYLRIITI